MSKPKFLLIQRSVPGAPNDGIFTPFDFDGLNNDEVKVITIDAPIDAYGNFDEILPDGAIWNSIVSNDFDVIAIPSTYGPSPLSYVGFQLAMHIRLSPELNYKRFVPIILMGFEEIGQLAQLACPYLSFLATPQVYYVEESFESLQTFIINELRLIRPINDQELIPSLSLYPINPQPHLESSHSLANEWGALELDKMTVNKLNGREKWLENSLYIKYLLAKVGYTSKQPKSIKLSEILSQPESFLIGSIQRPKVLYVDDEHNKGWEKVLRSIFDESEIYFECVSNLKKGQSRQETLKHIEQKINSDNWSLILLDVRLIEEDYKSENILNFSSLEILKFIKGRQIDNNGTLIWSDGIDPILPVIMFTASTKAKTLDIFLDYGSDGFFIKHNPDTSRRLDVIENDVTDFFLLIKTCLEKHRLLAPYWKCINEINSRNLIREKDEFTSSETCFRERIDERLRMFIGLQKKAYEQSIFDQEAFLYDEYETAFLTLWSCLNEILESYFNKKDNGEGMIEWKVETDEGEKNFITQAGRDNLSEYEILPPALNIRKFTQEEINNGDNKVDYNLKVQIQTAFLIQKYKPLRNAFNKYLHAVNGNSFDINTTLGKNLCDSEWQKVRSIMLAHLSDSNKKRNKLNLTHASNDLSDYTRTLRDSGAKVTNENIKDLFKLIYFLLKGASPIM